MSEAVIPRKKGDTFQALFFWFQACKIFDSTSGVHKIGYEIDTHDGFDDVVVYYKPALFISGLEIEADYFQVKYHSDQRNAFTAHSLIDPRFIGTKRKTILGRLKEIYYADKENYSRSRYHFISTWLLDSADDLKDLVKENGGINVKKLSLEKSNSRFGKIRKDWSEFLNVTEDELYKILGSLYIIAGKYTTEELNHRLNQQLNLVGLKPINITQRAGKYEDLLDKLHAEGNNIFDFPALLTICQRDELIADMSKLSNGNLHNRNYFSIKQKAQENVYKKLKTSYFALKYASDRYIERVIESDIQKWLELPIVESSSVFLVLASAGCGKTNTLAHVASIQSSKYLTFLISAPLNNFGNLGIWESVIPSFNFKPDERIDRIAIKNAVGALIKDFKSRVLFILDAINEYHQPIELKRELSIFLQEIDEIGASVIVSCRDYYWGLFDADWWAHFTTDRGRKKKVNNYSLANYNSNEALEAFRIYFEQYQVSVTPKGNAIEQFKHPLLLRFFCETYKGQVLGELKDVRLKDLFDKYWENKFKSLAERIIAQGKLENSNVLQEQISEKVISVALLMLKENTRSIAQKKVHEIMWVDGSDSILKSPYGRIMDEHIIMEELESYGYVKETKVAFVFEEFMEYAMARGLFIEWLNDNLESICRNVKILTEKYNDFNQVFGVLLYLALMLKEKRNLALWPALIEQGQVWQQVVIEAFKKLPVGQIDDGVFYAIVDLLGVRNPKIQIEALELLKYGRLKREPTTALLQAVGKLVTHKELSICRRAIIVLSEFSPEMTIPFIKNAISKPRSRQDTKAIIIQNSVKTLALLRTYESLRLMCEIFGGYWRIYNHREIVDILKSSIREIIGFASDTNILVRCGAIDLLGYCKFPEILEDFENRLLTKNFSTREYNKNELPEWFESVGMSVSGENAVKKDYEKRLLLDAVKKMKENIEDSELERIWKLKISSVKKHEVIHELPYSIDSLSRHYHYERLIIFIIKSGLEKRSDKKWTIKSSFNGYCITSPAARRKDDLMSVNDAQELGALLGLDKISQGGYEFGTGSRDHNYWKEYIYRAWGLPPKVFGHYEHSWD